MMRSPSRKEERMGVKKRVGDYPFLQQCAEKIAEEIAGSGDSSRCFFQLVTYSGHGPFIIPDEYKRISFSPGMPEVLNNYPDGCQLHRLCNREVYRTIAGGGVVRRDDDCRDGRP